MLFNGKKTAVPFVNLSQSGFEVGSRQVVHRSAYWCHRRTYRCAAETIDNGAGRWTMEQDQLLFEGKRATSGGWCGVIAVHAIMCYTFIESRTTVCMCNSSEKLFWVFQHFTFQNSFRRNQQCDYRIKIAACFRVCWFCAAYKWFRCRILTLRSVNSW